MALPPVTMIDINRIRDHPEEIKKAVVAKNVEPALVDQVLEFDQKRRVLLQEIENLRARRNEIAKLARGESKEGKNIKEELKIKEPELTKIEACLDQILQQIPNPPAPDVKIGKDESENEVLRQWGKPKEFDFKPRDHLELGEKLDLIDVERAGKVSGSRFAYLKGDAVLLEFALVHFALDNLIQAGFTPVLPPVLIKKEMMAGMGYLEHGGEEDMYKLEKDALILVGTSEQSLGPLHAGEILENEKLPLRYAGFSTCFRREAGSWGQDTRGILRVHQFDKVEMFSLAHPKESDEEHEYLLSLEEKFFQRLEIPYRVVKMCSGDLGAPAARKYDLEAWLPGQDRFREVTSASNTTDFQARRLNIKYRESGKIEYVHLLNGTAFAIGRTLIAILENYQNADGSVVIPKVLREYVGKKII